MTTKKTQESEKTLEARLVREIEARGGMALKYTSQYHRGIPDRIILMPYGRIYFVELKSTGKKPTKLQRHAIEKINELGYPAWIIDNTPELERLLLCIDREQGYFQPRPPETPKPRIISA